MKKYFGLFLFLTLSSFVLTACLGENEEEEMEEMEEMAGAATSQQAILDTTDYPAAIDDYVLLNYPEPTIDEVELLDDGNYEVELSDRLHLLFDPDGDFLEELPDDDPNI